jgi:hypothetical protein
MRARRERDVFVLGDEQLLPDVELAPATTPDGWSEDAEQQRDAFSDRQGQTAVSSRSDAAGGEARATTVRGTLGRWVLSRSSQARLGPAPAVVLAVLVVAVLAVAVPHLSHQQLPATPAFRSDARRSPGPAGVHPGPDKGLAVSRRGAQGHGTIPTVRETREGSAPVSHPSSSSAAPDPRSAAPDPVAPITTPAPVSVPSAQEPEGVGTQPATRAEVAREFGP